jgi:hypothetical protein
MLVEKKIVSRKLYSRECESYAVVSFMQDDGWAVVDRQQTRPLPAVTNT